MCWYGPPGWVPGAHPATATAEPTIADPRMNPRRLDVRSRSPAALFTSQLVKATPLLSPGGALTLPPVGARSRADLTDDRHGLRERGEREEHERTSDHDEHEEGYPEEGLVAEHLRQCDVAD